MARFDRSNSILQLTTSPLGQDVLVPTAISGHEAISQPFSYRVQMISDQGGIDPDQMLHMPGCLVLRRDQEPARYFHGIFQEFAASGQARPDIFAYTAVLVPKVWFLSQTIDCRVFQEKSVKDILEQMFQDAGVTDVDFRLYAQPHQRAYTVQFNETDLQFATRLMEETGLFYFFEHDADRHTLVITDNNDAFHDIPDASLRFDANIVAEDVLNAWNRPRGTTHGKVTLKDYDPTQPGKLLQKDHEGDMKVGGAANRDVFLWPAATHAPQVVSNRSELMVQAAQAAVSVVSGAGSFRPLTSGAGFTLEQDPLTGEQGTRYIVRWMSFEAVDESWSTDGAPAHYANSFDCFPASVTWRQPFSVDRPDMGGIHSAIVLGPEGEEIYTDKYARVKIKFFWDYRGEATADKSVWARVMQPWAGPGWGWQFIPRVGTEVAVAFIDGDADRPIVLGGLYNGDQMPIYPPESEKTKSGLRTRSTLKGGSSEFNELTFEDKKGEELVFVQAQKDMSTKVKHDDRLEVGHDQSISIGNNRTEKVGNDEKIDIGNDRTETVGNDEKVTISNNRTVQIQQGDDKLTIQQGDLSIEVSMGKATVTAMQSIELIVGSSKVRIDQTGVSISGTLIDISGDASVSVGAPMVSVSGDATVSIDGGMVEIN
jgi:type VI secretion system secreted protein VgrG